MWMFFVLVILSTGESIVAAPSGEVYKSKAECELTELIVNRETLYRIAELNEVVSVSSGCFLPEAGES